MKMSKTVRAIKSNNLNDINKYNYGIILGANITGKMFTPNETLIITPIEHIVGEVKPNRILHLKGEGDIETRFIRLGNQDIKGLDVIGIVHSRIFREPYTPTSVNMN